MSALRKQEGSAARALEFVILTRLGRSRRGPRFAARSTSDGASLRPPALPCRRRAGRSQHRAAAGPADSALDTSLVDDSEVIFQSRAAGRSRTWRWSPSVVGWRPTACRTASGRPFATGVRSNTNVAREVAEMALAHAVGNEVEAAYRRGDLFEKRRVLMDDWAAFCARRQATAEGQRESLGDPRRATLGRLIAPPRRPHPKNGY